MTVAPEPEIVQRARAILTYPNKWIGEPSTPHAIAERILAAYEAGLQSAGPPSEEAVARELPDDIFERVLSWIKTAHRDMDDDDYDPEAVAENTVYHIWDVLRPYAVRAIVTLYPSAPAQSDEAGHD